ncbi:MAG TPA: ATP-binding protein [Vicinamibacterales bacterium]|nr:ATP-binding protein [Vicinamibacterales bacterium]
MWADSDAERLSLALSAANLGDWSWDAATDVVTFSARAAEIFDIPPGPQMTWTDMRELLHPDDRERARIAVERSIETRSDYDIEYRLINGNHPRWVLARGRAIFSAEHALVGMLGVVQDITSQVHTREQLRAQAESLETINRIGRMLAAELDLERLVQGLTDAATALTGAQFGAFFYNVLDNKGGSYMLYTLSGVAREHFSRFPMPRATALFGPTFRGEGVVRIDDVREDPRFAQNPPYHGMPPGHLPVVSYLAVPVVSRSNEVLGGLFFGHRDRAVFTERVERIVVGLAGQAAIAIDNARLFESANRAREVAEEANRLKDDFLATVSHELRTPLNAVLGWARLLRGPHLDETRRAKALETIERNVKIQQEIIEDLLDISRIISGKLRLDVTQLSLSAVVEAAVEALRPAALAKGIRVQMTLATNDGLVLGDAGRLQQVVWNLMSNALKFTPKGGRVQVTLRRVNSHLELRVADTGCGIAPSFLPHVFDRFRQAESGTTRSAGGLGLGLAIVRHVVEMHGGSVKAFSDGEGKGAAFVVELPVAVLAQAGNATDARDIRHHSPPPSPAAEQATLEGLSVLVVDDEADTRELVQEVLKQHGALVRGAASAAEAWTLLRQWSPHVILSDIGMPEQDGYQFIERIRAEGNHTPAAALTAYARSTDRVRALSAGFQSHVPKPAEPSELVAIVASLAARNR